MRPTIIWAVALVSAPATQPVRPASPLESINAVSTAIVRPQATTLAIRAAIRTRLTGGPPHRLGSVELNKLYDTELPAPLWVDTIGRPSGAAGEALMVLR